MKNFMGLILCFISFELLACPSRSEAEFRENLFQMSLYQDYSFGFDAKNTGKVKKKDFEEIVAAIEKVYIPKFKAQNEVFGVVASWNSPVVNASAEIDNGEKLILLHGGFARLNYMTYDTFLLVACHEVGHHLGGLPLKAKSNWPASAEGQADYFATLKCFKEVLKANPQILSQRAVVSVPKETVALCKKQYPDEADYKICMRGAQAAYDFGVMDFIYKYPKEEVDISLTKTLPPLRTTFTMHPEPQCRAETLYQGILCNKPTNISLSFSDETQGTCHEDNFARVGQRPKCWFVSR